MKRSIFKIVTCVAACAAVATLHGQPNTDKLSSEIGKDVLEQNQKLRSANGQYELVMQSDGHLCIYKNGQFVWGNGSYRKGAPPYKLAMQADSNLVVYGSSGAIWASGVRSNGMAPYTVRMQDDGNLAIYDSTGRHVWDRINSK
jgi:hypothetical protein